MFQIHPGSVILKYGLVIFTDRGLVAIEGEEAFSHTTHTCDDDNDDQTAASSERRPERIPASPLLSSLLRSLSSGLQIVLPQQHSLSEERKLIFSSSSGPRRTRGSDQTRRQSQNNTGVASG